MYGLYGALLLKGEVVIPNAVFNDSENVVGIYPEIIHGNELQAKTVVRYILNKPGVMASNGIPGPKVFGKDDLLFTFSKMFMDLPEERVMFLPVINTAVFYDQKKTRTKTAVFFGKGDNTSVHPEDSIVIDRTLAQDQELLANLLSECHTIYSYDPVSAMTEVARLCGCKVIYCNRTYNRSDYDKYEPGTLGMTFPDEDTIQELDTEAFTAQYKGLQAQFLQDKLPKFIEITQKA